MSTKREGGNIIYEYTVDQTKTMEDSEIQKFYAGVTVLVTGGTGFLGKLLIEKLLRSCPNIEKILLMIRPKKNKDPHKRLEEQFDDVIYDKLKKMQPNFKEKVEIIEGNIGQDDLGLNDVDKKRIVEEVDIILHGAATVRLDETLKKAVQINVKGTKDMLFMAKACTKLKAFVYTSTAYSNCVRSHIGEEFYDTPMPADKIIDLVSILDENLLEKFKNDLLGDFPNSYAYSKALAENLIREYSRGLPLAVIRPSMVISTASEPIPGWIDNIYGPTGVVVSAALGILHCLRCDPEKLADIVPGDYVVNTIIAAAWRVAKDYPGNRPNPSFDLEPPIYNIVSSVENAITWKSFERLTGSALLNYPITRSIWCYTFYLIPNKRLSMLLSFLMHWIPAYIIDGALVLMTKKPMLVNIYKKIHKFSNLISYFNTQEWKFENANTNDLFNSMCPTDRDNFNFDFKSLEWTAYMANYLKGIRAYYVKDPMETIPEAKRKQCIFKCLQYIICLVFLYLLYKLIKFLLWCVFKITTGYLF